MVDLKGKKVLVTGGAGFIGSNIVDRLVSLGCSVIVYDNFSTGNEKFLDKSRSQITIICKDLLDQTSLNEAMKGVFFVFHLAANADVRNNVNEPVKCLEQNTIATSNVLEAMRLNGVKNIMFASTGSVYGEATVIPTPEDYPISMQTSLYAASKLAGEQLIQAYCEGYGMQGWIFRFVSFLGERYTHGHVFDFYKKLLANPHELPVLGNGHQKKSYVLVSDGVDAIFFAIEKANDKVNTFNLGTNEYCEVNDSIGWITAHLGVKPKLIYSGGERGWIGDNPFIFLDTSKINKLGWKPKATIQESVVKTVEFLQRNEWVLQERK